MWEKLSRRELGGSVGGVRRWPCAAHGGSVLLFSIAEIDGRFGRRTARRLSGWIRDYQREVALADFGCGVVGVFMAAQLRFGNEVTSTYLALSLALPVLWITALWLAGAYDVRFIGTGSDEYP